MQVSVSWQLPKEPTYLWRSALLDIQCHRDYAATVVFMDIPWWSRKNKRWLLKSRGIKKILLWTAVGICEPTAVSGIAINMAGYGSTVFKGDRNYHGQSVMTCGLQTLLFTRVMDSWKCRMYAIMISDQLVPFQAWRSRQLDMVMLPVTRTLQPIRLCNDCNYHRHSW